MKHFPPSLAVLVLALSPLTYGAPQARPPVVGKVSVIAESPLQLHIATSAPLTPQTQMVAEPDRLVIDFPEALPGATLHKLVLKNGAVRAVRASLYSRKPLVTRVVVDMVSPQWYRIVPDASGLLVTVGGSPSSTEGNTTVGWVSTRSNAARSVHEASTTVRNQVPAAIPHTVPVNGVSVDFADGLLTIHANNATLSEVLFQIQKKTGAEIAIPAGTEQERVAVDIGPDTPSSVLDQLLNGSDLNFVVVGAAGNPNQLRSVILSRKEPDSNPVAFTQSYTPPVAQNMQPPRTDPNVMPGIDTPEDAPPADQPQDTPQ